MSWFLFEENSSYCVVHEKNVLQAGSEINVGDICKFFYQGIEYDGKVQMKNADHTVLNEELKRLKKDMNNLKRRGTVNQSAVELPAKRKVQPVDFYGAKQLKSNVQKRSDNTRPKMTEEEKKRQRILELNKKEAERRANNQLLAKVKQVKESSDTEWDPSNINDDDSSQDSVIKDVAAHGVQMKANRTNLLKTLSSERPVSTIASSSLPSASASPTKEELKRELEMMKIKLQMIYDDCPANKGDNQRLDLGSTEREGQNNGRKSEFNEGPSKDISDNVDPMDADDFRDIADNSNHEDNSRDLGSSNKPKDKDVEEIKKDDSMDTNANKSEVDESQKDDSMDENLNRSSDQTDPKLDDININDNEDQMKQLYRKQADTTELCRGIYWKTDVLTRALTNSSNVSHLVRRLMTGVFIPSKLNNCTVSGQSWRAGGPEKAQEAKIPLHQGALKAIVDFSNGVAKKKKWTIKKFEKCKPIFARRLIEIKKQLNDGKLKD